MEECICGKRDVAEHGHEPWPWMHLVPWWFHFASYFRGHWRLISACSGDCVEAAKAQAKKYYEEEELGMFLGHVDASKLVRVK